MAKDEKIEIAALGQPFQLGMLYDQRRDRIVAGVTLWDADKLKDNINSTPRPSTNFELVTEDTLNAKTHVLGIEAELKLSILSGLVSVSGAAKYVDDQKTSNSQARITGRYTTTTQYDELTMTHLAEKNIQHTNILNHPDISATHVVVGILYGADAFFIFDRSVSSNENHKDVSGKLKILVNKIPKLSVDGSGQLNLDEKDKELNDKLSCKFYGDFRFARIPTTFEDAVKLYCELPALINHTNGVEGVPKRVWLHPLNAFAQHRIGRIVRDISCSLIDLSVNRIQILHELKIKASDLINHNSTLLNNFSNVKKQLDDFISRLSEFDRQFKEHLRILLPKIRGDDEETLALDRLSQTVDSSPFNTQKLDSWLSSKEKELALLDTFISALQAESVPVISTPLIGIIGDIKYDFVCRLCFHFTELNEPQIFQMSNYLYNSPGETSTTAATTTAWYDSPDIINKIRTELCQFIGFVKANKKNPTIHFVVNQGHADDHYNVKGASVTLYKHALLDTLYQIPSQPGIPKPTQITPNSITLDWTKPERGYDCIIKYKISYRIHQNRQENDENKTWNEIMTDSAVESNMVSNLTENTAYVFQVQAVTIAGDSMPSDISCPIATPRSSNSAGTGDSASGLKIKRKIAGINGYPTIHEIQYHEHVINQSLRLRKCYIGQPTMLNGCSTSEKIIMMVGATGAGKSTMINAFVNYYYGIQWKDNFRLKLITEEDEGINGVAQSQTKSQTKFITAYTLYYQSGCAVPYTLIIIDTPGFGDVEGIKRDEEITNQIREFFLINGPNGIDHLDAIGFVVQNSINRLTHTQKYIFDSILSIFGKDISSNIFPMITYADGQIPPVLEALEKANISSKIYFKFNNSALYAANNLNDEDDDINVDEMFWKIGIGSLRNFLIEFQKMESVSLKLTKEVLDERQHLEAFVQGIQEEIRIGLGKLEELKQEIEVLKEHYNDILKNKSFKYTIKVTKQRQISLPEGIFVTNCLRCNRTCHYPCTIQKDNEKYRCAAMGTKDQNSKCTVCSNKCSWTSHANNCYRYELYEEEEIRTIEDMMKRYQKAKTDGTVAQDVYECLKKDFKNIQMKVYGMIAHAQEAIERLDQIALKPNPLTIVNYIELMIESEQQEAKPGFKQRIQQLTEAKKNAEIIQRLKTEGYDGLNFHSSDLERLDQEFKELVNQMKEQNTTTA